MSTVPLAVSLSASGAQLPGGMVAASSTASLPVDADHVELRRSLTLENWVFNHQSGQTRLVEDPARLAAALEDLRGLEDAMETFKKSDLRNAASLLGLVLSKDKKLHKTEIVQWLREHARQRRNHLSGTGAASSHSSDEDDSDEDEQSDEEPVVEGRAAAAAQPEPTVDEEHKSPPPPTRTVKSSTVTRPDPLASPKSGTSASRSRRRSTTRHAAQYGAAPDEDEYEECNGAVTFIHGSIQNEK